MNTSQELSGSHKSVSDAADVVPFATKSSATCAPWVSQSQEYDAVLLLSFGGPNGQEDVIPFLRNVTRGRGIPDERLEEVAHHYRHYGGVSPINEQNRSLHDALDAALKERGFDKPVLWGNRNWSPFVGEVMAEASAAGIRRVLTVTSSAYSSYSSCRQYREDLAESVIANDLQDELQVDKVRQYFNHPGFVQPYAEGVRDAVAEFLSSGVPISKQRVLFTTHSIPDDDAALSGPEGAFLNRGGAYTAQHLAVSEQIIRDVIEQIPEAVELGWELVYQSRSGPPQQCWLEPDICDRIEQLPAEGVEAVAVAPIGFVSDHMEVLWDLDNEAADAAAEANLRFIRTRTAGTHPAFVSALADLVLERVNGVVMGDRAVTTGISSWFDVCRPGCCENKRLGFKPAAAGLAP